MFTVRLVRFWSDSLCTDKVAVPNDFAKLPARWDEFVGKIDLVAAHAR
jgi:hypothetical protein